MGIPGVVFNGLFETLLAVVIGLLVLFIWGLRRTHADQIYVTWLLFSVFFVVFFFLFHINVGDVFGKSGQAIYDATYPYLTNFQAEVDMVVVIVGFVVLPQLLTYFLCGLSGSAFPPVFVSQITKMAIWSLVKFLAVYAGILMAYPIARWSMGRGEIKIDDILVAVFTVTAGFFILWVYYGATRIIDFLFRRKAFSLLRNVHEFFTRYSRPVERPLGLTQAEATNVLSVNQATISRDMQGALKDDAERIKDSNSNPKSEVIPDVSAAAQ
jgi:hypothetical protein